MNENIFITTIKTDLNGFLEQTQLTSGIMMTGDNNANHILVELYRGFERVLIDASAKVIGYFIRNDGQTVEVEGEIEAVETDENGETTANQVKVIMPAVAYSVAGPLNIAIRLLSGQYEDTDESGVSYINWRTKIVVASLSCFVNDTETDSIIDINRHIPSVEELLAYIDNLNALQTTFIVNDANRESAEIIRQTQETARGQAESTRQTQEEARNQAESIRQTQETARGQAESTRQTQEQIRQTAESERVTNEQTRQTTETTRESNEQTRQTAESERVTNEQTRQTAESERVTNEQARQAAETTRKTQEAARQAAEATRESNEQTRQTDTEARLAKIDNMTVEAISLPAYSDPTVAITEVGGYKHIVFGLRPGDPFVIRKEFASIAEMNAYTGTDVKAGEFVIIASDVEDPDNAKMYLKTESEGYMFITDLSGSQGIRGPQGYSISSVQLNNDYTLTVTLTNGQTFTTTSIRGEQGIQGVSISKVQLNSDYTLTVTLTNGQTFTTTSIRGAQGIQGIQGESISNVQLNNDYTLTVTLTNGQTFTTSPIRGEKGEKGEKGDQGEPGINGAHFDFDSTTQHLHITYNYQ